MCGPGSARKRNDVTYGMSEDDEKNAEKELQKLTDQYIGKIDEHLKHKEKEILTV